MISGNVVWIVKVVKHKHGSRQSESVVLIAMTRVVHIATRDEFFEINKNVNPTSSETNPPFPVQLVRLLTVRKDCTISSYISS